MPVDYPPSRPRSPEIAAQPRRIGEDQSEETEGPSSLDVCGQIVDEDGPDGIEAEAFAKDLEDRGIGFDEPFTPGDDDILELCDRRVRPAAHGGRSRLTSSTGPAAAFRSP
jgi:hypothetical protein